MEHEKWLEQLRTWHETGTFDRLRKAMEAKASVEVKRSDGSYSSGVIESTAGFGGRAILVRIDGDPPLYKSMPTDAFLERNDGFGPHLMHLTESEVG